MNPKQEKQPEQNEKSNLSVKTSDVYAVDENFPKRFNNPDCFQGYRWVLLQTQLLPNLV